MKEFLLLGRLLGQSRSIMDWGMFAYAVFRGNTRMGGFCFCHVRLTGRVRKTSGGAFQGYGGRIQRKMKHVD